VDTRDNVIVRQELAFERSPVPLLIRKLDRMVVERERVDGHWVMTRVLMHAEFTLPMPSLGRVLEFSMLFHDYRVNRGIDPQVFETKGHPIVYSEWLGAPGAPTVLPWPTPAATSPRVACPCPTFRCGSMTWSPAAPSRWPRRLSCPAGCREN
jgi:hypothetical protein